MEQKQQTSKEFWIKAFTAFVAAIAALVVYDKFIKPRLKK